MQKGVAREWSEERNRQTYHFVGELAPPVLVLAAAIDEDISTQAVLWGASIDYVHYEEVMMEEKRDEWGQLDSAAEGERRTYLCSRRDLVAA